MEPCVVLRRSLWAAGAITSALTTAVDQQPYSLRGAFEGGSVMYISVPTSDSHVISVETKLAVTHSHTLLAGGWLESTSQRE